MPYTKIFTIKDNPQRSINYITNEKKAINYLIYTNYCSIKNAGFDFSAVREMYKSKVTVKARHIIQSYKPDENITKEIAFKIAKEFSQEHLKDYQYVISVHEDKEHIHAHIVFNTVNYKTGKAYKSNKETFNKILLKDFNKVLEDYNLNKAINSKKESKSTYYKSVNLRTLLKNDIDRIIKISKTFEIFLKNMSIDYIVDNNGKYLKFKHKKYGKKFIRANDTLGENYTREKIKERINSTIEYAIIDEDYNEKKDKTNDKDKKFNKKNNKKYVNLSNKYDIIKENLGFIIDTKQNKKARTIKPYQNWARKNNLKTINNNYIILQKKYNIKYDFIENIDKIINQNNQLFNSDISDNEKEKIKLNNYELNIIKKNIVKYENSEVLYVDKER